jgi:hypothetical protein
MNTVHPRWRRELVWIAVVWGLVIGALLIIHWGEATTGGGDSLIRLMAGLGLLLLGLIIEYGPTFWELGR